MPVVLKAVQSGPVCAVTALVILRHRRRRRRVCRVRGVVWGSVGSIVAVGVEMGSVAFCAEYVHTVS